MLPHTRPTTTRGGWRPLTSRSHHQDTRNTTTPCPAPQPRCRGRGGAGRVWCRRGASSPTQYGNEARQLEWLLRNAESELLMEREVRRAPAGRQRAPCAIDSDNTLAHLQHGMGRQCFVCHQERDGVSAAVRCWKEATMAGEAQAVKAARSTRRPWVRAAEAGHVHCWFHKTTPGLRLPPPPCPSTFSI